MKHAMNLIRLARPVSLWAFIVLACSGDALAQTSTVTYQGRLTDSASPANDTYEMQFSLFGSVAGNDQIGSTISNSSVTVTNGVFTVQLDFSPATPFATGADRWLQIAVRKASGPAGFTTLSPRQQITSSPYSIRTLSASVADSLSSACVGCVNDNNVSDTLTIGPTSTVSDSALSTQVARLNGAQTITGDWINTANPWADNEVSDTLTIGAGSTVSDSALSAQIARLNGAQTITGNWINTANPWADSEVSDTLTIGAGSTVSDAALSANVVRTSGAIMTGPLNMNNSVITNIGAAGTNFSATGGLTLADTLQLAGGETISNAAGTLSFTGPAGSLSLSLAGPNPTLSSATGVVIVSDNFEVAGSVTALAGSFTSLRTTAGPITTPTRSVTSSTSLNATDSVLFVETSGGNVTVTLPAAGASTVGRVYYVFMTGGPNLVFVARAGSDTVNGTTQIALVGTNHGVRIIGASATSWFASRLQAED